jgi:hypothetical protein
MRKQQCEKNTHDILSFFFIENKKWKKIQFWERDVGDKTWLMYKLLYRKQQWRERDWVWDGGEKIHMICKLSSL